MYTTLNQPCRCSTYLSFVLVMFALASCARVDSTVIKHVAIVGESVSLNCNIKGAGIMVWDRHHDSSAGAIAINARVKSIFKSKYTLTTDGNSQILTIHNLTMNDNDFIRCYSFSSEQFVKFNVIVLGPPSNLMITEPSSAVDEGSTVTLKCTATEARPAPTITWSYRDYDGNRVFPKSSSSDVVLAQGVITRTSILSVRVQRELYGVELICSAVSENVSYSETKTATLNINLRPLTPSIRKQDIPAEEGLTAHLVCEVRGSKPAAEITWYKNNQPVTGGETHVMKQPNGTFRVLRNLEMVAERKDDGAIIECQASNDVTKRAGVSAVSSKMIFSVNYSPIVTVKTSSSMVLEDRSVTFTCDVDAKPPPISVIWFHGYRQLSKHSAEYLITFNSTQSTLTIPKVKRPDRGDYRCRVTNRVAVISSATVALSVLHAPYCLANQAFKYGASINETVTLRCDVEAYPSDFVNFEWKIKGKVVKTKGIQSVDQPAQAYSFYNYTIRSASDYTDVICVVSNGVGGMSQPCVLKVLKPGPAEAPLGCNAVSVQHSSILLTCIPSYDGGSPVTYSLQSLVRAPDDYAVLREETMVAPVFNITQLSPERKYILRVCVSNRQFRQIVACTDTFTVTTSESSKNSSTLLIEVTGERDYVSYLLIGLFLAFASICACFFCFIKKRRDERYPVGQGLRRTACSMKRPDMNTDKKWASLATATSIGDNPQQEARDYNGSSPSFVTPKRGWMSHMFGNNRSSGACGPMDDANVKKDAEVAEEIPGCSTENENDICPLNESKEVESEKVEVKTSVRARPVSSIQSLKKAMAGVFAKSSGEKIKIEKVKGEKVNGEKEASVSLNKDDYLKSTGTKLDQNDQKADQEDKITDAKDAEKQHPAKDDKELPKGNDGHGDHIGDSKPEPKCVEEGGEHVVGKKDDDNKKDGDHVVPSGDEVPVCNALQPKSSVKDLVSKFKLQDVSNGPHGPRENSSTESGEFGTSV